MIDFFTRRPIFASAIALLMVMAGAISYFMLPISQLPDVVPPTVVVTAKYPGASAQVVADTVTTPLEQQINGVDGMMYMSSSSSNDGTAQIIVTFKVGYPQDIAAVDVQNRVSQAAASLPPIVSQGGVTVQKQGSSLVGMVSLNAADGALDPVTMSNYAYTQVIDQLKRVPGIAEVRVFGERRYSMRIWLDPDKLSTLGITAVDVQNAIAEQNVQVAAGKLGQAPSPSGTAFEAQVSATGRLSTPEAFGDIIVRADSTTGALVRLRDVARIELGSLTYSSSAYENQKPSIFLGIFQAPGTNSLKMRDDIKATMDRLALNFPKGMTYGMKYDTTRFVAAAMKDVVKTLLEALLLVVAVVFIFLQRWRTTLIPLIAIPVSLIATLAVMLALGFSLNMLSMLGIVLAIGLVVDDAIVVVENVERQLEAGHPPLEATRLAMKEVTGPIIATTAVLMAVFVPVAFIPGVMGRFYNQFALTVAISVAISAFNSLTLSPALAAALLRHQPASDFFVYRWFNATFDQISHGYAAAVPKLVKARWMVLGGFVAVSVATWLVSTRLPSSFLPSEDQGYVLVVAQLPDGASLQRTEAFAAEARKIMAAAPGVADAYSINGFNLLNNAAQSNTAQMFAILRPWDQRGPDESSTKILEGLRPKLAALSEGVALAFDAPPVQGMGQLGGFEFVVEDRSGKGAEALSEAAQAVLTEARKRPELDPNSLFSTFSTTTPQYNYDLDRNKAKMLGLNLPDVFSTLQIYLGSLYVNDFNILGRNFRVTLQAEQAARADPTGLDRLYVRNSMGEMVPLGTLGGLKSVIGPETVTHYNNYASATINGAAAPGYSSGQAMAAMEAAAAKALPKGFASEWTGVAFQEKSAGSVAGLVFGLAMICVFLILAAQYESWSMPFMVLLSVPLALFGALGALWVRGLAIDVFAQIGLVMLIGLAAKNSILIVEFARRLREEGFGIVEAAAEAGRLRLRPILMTAFAFILGVVPLMLAGGAGALSRQSIGTTVFGGMLVATLLTLAAVPVFYAVIEEWRERRHGASTAPVADTAPHAGPAE